jgi:hypothetical protein
MITFLEGARYAPRYLPANAMLQSEQRPLDVVTPIRPNGLITSDTYRTKVPESPVQIFLLFKASIHNVTAECNFVIFERS